MINFNRVFPKLQIEHLTGSCTEPFNCVYIVFPFYVLPLDGEQSWIYRPMHIRINVIRQCIGDIQLRSGCPALSRPAYCKNTVPKHRVFALTACSFFNTVYTIKIDLQHIIYHFVMTSRTRTLNIIFKQTVYCRQCYQRKFHLLQQV